MRYKKSIEELENHIQNISVRDCELLDAIDFAIGVMMEVDSAEKVMPANIYSDIASQKVLEKCTLTHAKVVGELKDRISRMEKGAFELVDKVHCCTYGKDTNDKLRAEIAELKRKDTIHWKIRRGHVNKIAELEEKLKKYEGD